jgi:LysM repeat protein
MTYTVKAGDSLSRIANQYGVSIEELIDSNSGQYPSLVDDPDAIQVGWTFTIPGTTEVVPSPQPLTQGVSVMPTASVASTSASPSFIQSILANKPLAIGLAVAIAAVIYYFTSRSGLKRNPLAVPHNRSRARRNRKVRSS